MRSAISPNDPRVAVLVGALDAGDEPIAETWRRVAGASEQLGLSRPSYQHVRRLVWIERRRKEFERAGRAVLGRAAFTLAAGRVPSAISTLERLQELQRREKLVLQEHKAFSGATVGATELGRRSREP